MDLPTYPPDLVKHIIDQYPPTFSIQRDDEAKEDDPLLTQLFNQLCNTLDTLARYNDPQQERMYVIPADRTHPSLTYPSLFNLAGKLSLLFRFQTLAQLRAYKALLRSTRGSSRLINDDTFYLALRRIRIHYGNTPEQEYMGYQPWQAFWMLYQLGILAYRRISTTNTFQNAPNSRRFREIISHVMNTAMENGATRPLHYDILLRDFFHASEPDQDAADPLQLISHPIPPYAMMKRLLHVIQAVGQVSVPARRDILHAYLRRALQTHLLFYSGTASSNGLYSTYENPKKDVFDEIDRALKEETTLLRHLNYPTVEHGNLEFIQPSLNIFEDIHHQLDEDYLIYSFRPLAFMMSQHRRLGQQSIAHIIDTPVAKMIAQEYDLTHWEDLSASPLSAFFPHI